MGVGVSVGVRESREERVGGMSGMCTERDREESESLSLCEKEEEAGKVSV